MEHDHYPCRTCSRYCTCVKRGMVCDDWRDWFRHRYREACAVMLYGMQVRKMRMRQNAYALRLYREETGGWE